MVKTYKVRLCKQSMGDVIVFIDATSAKHALKRAKKLYPLYSNIEVM